MTNLQILSKEIRQFDGLYSLNDLHKASGGEVKNKPVEFLRNQKTKDLISLIERGGKSHTAIKTKRGGNLQGTFACKQLVVAYGSWINPEIHLAVIDAFLDRQEQLTLEAPKEGLTPAQQHHIQSRVKYLVNNQTGTSYGGLYGSIKNKFKVGTYKDIPSEHYPALCNFLGCKPQSEQAEKSQYYYPIDSFKPDNQNGNTDVNLSGLLERVKEEPLHNLLKELSNNGHDVSGAINNYRAMRTFLDSAYKNLNSIGHLVQASVYGCFPYDDGFQNDRQEDGARVIESGVKH